jgi:hypothetical protein
MGGGGQMNTYPFNRNDDLPLLKKFPLGLESLKSLGSIFEKSTKGRILTNLSAELRIDAVWHRG